MARKTKAVSESMSIIDEALDDEKNGAEEDHFGDESGHQPEDENQNITIEEHVEALGFTDETINLNDFAKEGGGEAVEFEGFAEIFGKESEEDKKEKKMLNIKDIDYSELSLDELRAIRTDLDREIANFEANRRKEALAAAEAAVKQLGFSLAQLMGGSSNESSKEKKTRKPVDPKYANPANASDTWTGRGRKPKWVVAHLEEGGTLDQVAIGA